MLELGGVSKIKHPNTTFVTHSFIKRPWLLAHPLNDSSFLPLRLYFPLLFLRVVLNMPRTPRAMNNSVVQAECKKPAKMLFRCLQRYCLMKSKPSFLSVTHSSRSRGLKHRHQPKRAMAWGRILLHSRVRVVTPWMDGVVCLILKRIFRPNSRWACSCACRL